GSSIPFLQGLGWWQIDIRAEEVCRRGPLPPPPGVGGGVGRGGKAPLLGAGPPGAPPAGREKKKGPGSIPAPVPHFVLPLAPASGARGGNTSQLVTSDRAAARRPSASRASSTPPRKRGPAGCPPAETQPASSPSVQAGAARRSC